MSATSATNICLQIGAHPLTHLLGTYRRGHLDLAHASANTYLGSCLCRNSSSQNGARFLTHLIGTERRGHLGPCLCRIKRIHPTVYSFLMTASAQHNGCTFHLFLCQKYNLSKPSTSPTTESIQKLRGHLGPCLCRNYLPGTLESLFTKYKGPY